MSVNFIVFHTTKLPSNLNEFENYCTFFEFIFLFITTIAYLCNI